MSHVTDALLCVPVLALWFWPLALVAALTLAASGIIGRDLAWGLGLIGRRHRSLPR